MNKSNCCELCSGRINPSGDTMDYGCLKDTCPCHTEKATTHEIEGWEKDEDLVCIMGYLNGTEAEYIKEFIKSLLTHQQERIVEAIEKLRQDEHPTEDGVPVETYGYEATHNQALKAAIEVVRGTIES